MSNQEPPKTANLADLDAIRAAAPGREITVTICTTPTGARVVTNADFEAELAAAEDGTIDQVGAAFIYMIQGLREAAHRGVLAMDRMDRGALDG